MKKFTGAAVVLGLVVATFVGTKAQGGAQSAKATGKAASFLASPDGQIAADKVGIVNRSELEAKIRTILR